MNKHCLPALLLLAACRHPKTTDWPVYGGGKDARHYSPLAQVDTANVGRLAVAWTYHTGDAEKGTQIQVNGLEAGGVFYGVSPKLRLFALDAATGRMLWVFDPGKTGESSLSVCRGVALYKDERVFYSAGYHLFCVDAHTGRLIESFGQNGILDLRTGLDRPVDKEYVASTTPGVIYKDLLIIGCRVDETTPAAPGSIRGYDVHTGQRRWIFHTIPWPGEAGYDAWADTGAWRYAGGANAWAGFSLDEANGIVYAPIGSASYDFYGGKRKGDDRYANCVLALVAATGQRVWHYQTVHHDLWDRDLPTAPVLVNVYKDNEAVAAVAQVTKSGFVFLLDRATGQPLYPVREVPVDTVSELAGEQPWPTQPEPTFLPRFAREDAGSLRTDAPDADSLASRYAGYRKGMFVPPSREGTVIFPGFDGGGEWGGPSYDPATGYLYVNACEMPWVLTMVDAPAQAQGNNGEVGKAIYETRCMSCHGPNRQGGGNYPSLLHAPKDYTRQGFSQLLATGRRMMPAFPDLDSGQRRALASFILEDAALQKETFSSKASAPQGYDAMPLTSTGYNKFLSKDGYPAITPPWGTLTAIDLNHGRIVWRDTLGDTPLGHTGTENYGGPVVTAGGLVFIAATRDARIRAYNKRDGRLLWEAALPACGFATPTIYAIDGKEYVVVACGGGKLNTPSGDAYVAFALP